MNACTKRAERKNKRIFGTYFRVRFFGNFQDPNAKCNYSREYIYKEPAVTKLGEISDKLLAQYQGAKLQVQLIDTSEEQKMEDISQMDLSHCLYIQITHVVPVLDDMEDMYSTNPYDQDAQTKYERHHNIRKFMFEVPTGPKGESVRKTLITTTHSFPFLKSRIETLRPHKIYDVKPVQVAIEKINGRSRSIEKVLENINKNSEREKQVKNRLQN